jgi:hypothetical protein
MASTAMASHAFRAEKARLGIRLGSPGFCRTLRHRCASLLVICTGIMPAQQETHVARHVAL